MGSPTVLRLQGGVVTMRGPQDPKPGRQDTQGLGCSWDPPKPRMRPSRALRHCFHSVHTRVFPKMMPTPYFSDH